MDIYENIVIGNFLYGLGFQIGRSSVAKPHAMAINLLQQTPMDKPLADLLMQGASVFRIIEFKRLKNKSNKEANKHTAVLRSVENVPDLKEFSLRSHWYVETELVKADFRTWTRPYLMLTERGKNIKFEDFILQTATASLSGKQDNNECRLFESYIAKLMRANNSSGGGSGALVFAASGNESGAPRYVAVRDLLDLKQTHRTIMQSYRKPDVGSEKEVAERH
jgi:hypothetical protein